MLKIWGRSNSANVQKVLWAADELGLDYEQEDVGGTFGRTKEPPYSDMNPNAVVPTLVEDDFVLWESNACTRYLANKHGKGTLAPTDPRDYADADRWMDWQQTTVLPFMTPIFWGYVRTPEEKRQTWRRSPPMRSAGGKSTVFSIPGSTAAPSSWATI